jgi:ribosomal protein L36
MRILNSTKTTSRDDQIVRKIFVFFVTELCPSVV